MILFVGTSACNVAGRVLDNMVRQVEYADGSGKWTTIESKVEQGVNLVVV